METLRNWAKQIVEYAQQSHKPVGVFLIRDSICLARQGSVRFAALAWSMPENLVGVYTTTATERQVIGDLEVMA